MSRRSGHKDIEGSLWKFSSLQRCSTGYGWCSSGPFVLLFTSSVPFAGAIVAATVTGTAVEGFAGSRHRLGWVSLA